MFCGTEVLFDLAIIIHTTIENKKSPFLEDEITGMFRLMTLSGVESKCTLSTLFFVYGFGDHIGRLLSLHILVQEIIALVVYFILKKLNPE